MALTILIRGHLSSIPELADVCFNKANYSATFPNTTLSVNTPRGVLGGSVAAVSANNDYTVVPCDLVLQPLGLFVNDAAGAAFENAPAVASGKVAVMKAMASVEVDVYETRAANNLSNIAYTVGDRLYSSTNGLLTNVQSTSTVIIGLLTKAPTVDSPTMGLDMRL